MKSVILCQALLASFVLAGGSSVVACPFTRTSPLKNYPPIRSPDLSVQTISTTLSSSELLIGSFGALYSSTNGGRSFKTMTKKGDNYWGAIKTSKGTYLTSSPQSLLRSTDGGASFTALNLMAPGGYPLSSTAGKMFAVIGDQIIWGTQNGFYASDDDGASWAPIDCKGLVPLSNTPNSTINECEYLFVRSMAVTPDSKQVLTVFSVVGLPGVYSLSVPVPKVNNVYTPTWNVHLPQPLCPGDANPIPGEGSLCSDSGPIAVFNGRVYVGSSRNLISFPLAASSAVVEATTVLTASTVETEMVGLEVSSDGKVLAASWSGGLYSSTSGNAGSWVQPDSSACSKPSFFNWNPTVPQGYFTRGLAPAGGPAVANQASFAVGTNFGPYIWTIKY